MFFPILGAHISRSEFQYFDLISKVLCDIMANLVAESGVIRVTITQPYSTITLGYSAIRADY